MFARTLAASLALLLLATAAHAGTSEAPGATQLHPPLDDATAARVMASLAPPETEAHWYGGELLTADALGAAVFLVGASSDSEVGNLAAIGATGSLALTPAILHARHGNMGRAAASLGMRVGLPVLGAAIGSATCTEDPSSDDWFQCLGSALGGFAVGALAAVIIDDGLLAWESRPVAARGSSLRVGIAPRADHGMTFSLAGAF